jgi:hypothetical protein
MYYSISIILLLFTLTQTNVRREVKISAADPVSAILEKL